MAVTSRRVATPELAGDVHPSEQNSLTECLASGDREPQTVVSAEMGNDRVQSQEGRAARWEWGRREGQFSKAGFRWRPEGGREVASGEWEEGAGC